MEDLEKILVDMGYHLLDRGNEFRAAALYRGGNNPSSLCISKRDGRWYDFKERIGGGFEELVKITLKVDQQEVNNILKNKNIASPITTIKKSIDDIKTKIFKKDQLDTLLKDHSYWIEKRGVSAQTISVFEGGIASSGKMKNRYVFPIFNKQKQLIGVSGRTYLPDDTRVKWKHIGVKANWLYPLQYNHNIITKSRKVILIESIGDMLALWDAGIKNTVVLFGLDCSITILNCLIKLNPTQIKISLNNDESGAGNNAAVKLKKKLDKYFDFNQSEICLPTKNDFGEMTKEEILDWSKQ